MDTVHHLWPKIAEAGFASICRWNGERENLLHSTCNTQLVSASTHRTKSRQYIQICNVTNHLWEMRYLKYKRKFKNSLKNVWIQLVIPRSH